MDDPPRGRPLIGVVGPCGSGKSTLKEGLERHGYTCRHIAQEHSYVPYMWQRITDPDILIYLEASFETCTARRQLNWNEDDYREQLRRLLHARQHASLIVDTAVLDAAQVLETILAFLRSTT